MAYSDEETRKDWKSLDKKALDGWAEEFEVDADEVVDFLKDYDGADKDNINSHIYGVLYIGGRKYLTAIREYCEENNIDLIDTKLDEDSDNYETDMDILNIYTNYLDSGFNSELSDLVTVNPDEENILEALEILDINVENKKNNNERIEVNVLKIDFNNVRNHKLIDVKEFENEKLATEFINDFNKANGDNLAFAELSSNSSIKKQENFKDETQMIEDFEYSVVDLNDDSSLQKLVQNFENSQQNEATGVERFNGKEVFLLEDWMPDSVFEKFNFYYENEKSSEETIDEVLINFDRLYVYENYDKNEMGEEIAEQLNLFNNLSDKSKDFVDFEAVADEYVNDDDSGYKQNANEEYYFIDNHQKLTGVFLGSVKNQLAVNEAFDFVQFEIKGKITNNGLYSSLSTKTEDLEFDNVFKYYNTATYISKEQWNNEIKPSLEAEDYKNAFEKIKSIRENVLLFKDEAEYEEYKKSFKNSSENKEDTSNKKTRKDR